MSRPKEGASLSPLRQELLFQDESPLEVDLEAFVDLRGRAAPIDLYVLTDASSSMARALEVARVCVQALLDKPGLEGARLRFGLGTYRDDRGPEGFTPVVALSESGQPVLDALQRVRCAGGGDLAEGQLAALWQVAATERVRWAPEARRVLLWFGDAPGHDPASLPDGGRVTEADARRALEDAGILLIGVSLPSAFCDGLDGAPAPGQATRLTKACGGELIDGLRGDALEEAVRQALRSALAATWSLTLSVEGDVARHAEVTSPSGGAWALHGPLEEPLPATLTYRPWSAPPHERVGQVVLRLDGEVVARQEVVARVRQPASRTPAQGCTRPELRPGSLTLTADRPPGPLTLEACLPLPFAARRVDLYLLADTTESMAEAMPAVQRALEGLLDRLEASDMDVGVGVGCYRDLPRDRYALRHQRDVSASLQGAREALRAWRCDGGEDGPEAQLLGLRHAAGASAGWRLGSERLLVWIGDAPGHDPLPAALTGLPEATTEASVTRALVEAGVRVFACSLDTGLGASGLDGDPRESRTTLGVDEAGRAGQASRIAAATGGALVEGLSFDALERAARFAAGRSVDRVERLRLLPSAELQGLVRTATPASGFGPFEGEGEWHLRFQVTLDLPTQGAVGGALWLVADALPVARLDLRLTGAPLPAEEPGWRYLIPISREDEAGFAQRVHLVNRSPSSASVRLRSHPLEAPRSGEAFGSPGGRSVDHGALELQPGAAGQLEPASLDRMVGALPEAGGARPARGLLELRCATSLDVVATWGGQPRSTSPVVPQPAR